MDVTLADRRLADVRAWWRVRHPPPTLTQKLDLAYTTAIVAAILSAVAYGTAGSALAEVLSPERLERFGPPAALVALALVARWGAFQGPVVFTVPDVAFLLGAPLPRRGLAQRRLALAFACGAAAGALLAAVIIVGLGDVTANHATMLAVAGAELGALGVAAAWAVERSARCEHAAWLATWPVAGAAAGLAAWAPRVPAVPALALLSLVTAVAVLEALRDCGHCSAERHLRRAEARQGAIASLAVYDLRTARRSLEAARPGQTASHRRLRRLPVPAIAWRDAVSALHAPGRVVEALALSAASAAVATAEADRPLVAAAAILAGYLGAARTLWPLRAELDVPARTRILLRPRSGRVLLEHLIVPASLTAAAGAAAGAAAALIAGHPRAGVAVIAIAVAPLLTLSAALSARRGGRVPQSVLVTALAADPTGGGTAIAGWFAWWPCAAVITGVAPLALAETGALAPATAWILAAAAILTWLAGRNVEAGSSP